jgi:hypothetical protein
MGRLTILVHAAPLSARASKMQARDVLTLVGSLSSLLNQLPARSVRLVVFNLEQQSVLLRKDGFTLADIEDVSKAIGQIQLSVVDYKTLRNTGGSAGLLADLIRAETQSPEPAEEVVFLGPPTRALKPAPQADFGKAEAGAPRFYYLQFRRLPRILQGRFGGRGGPPAGMGRGSQLSQGSAAFSELGAGDSIEQAVGRLKGSTIAVRTPSDFAGAITRMTRAKP